MGTEPPICPQGLEISISLARGVRIAPLDHQRVRGVVRAAARAPLTLSLRFAGREEARELNRRFRRRRYVPNVLTFGYPESRSADVVICTPVVREEARAQRKSFADHLSHMLVHAVLHAQGFDHEEDEAALRMERRERAILARLGIADPYRKDRE